MPLDTITVPDHKNIASCLWNGKGKRFYSADPPRATDENSPPPGRIADQFQKAGESLHDPSLTPVQSASCADEPLHGACAPFSVDPRSCDGLTGVLCDIPEPVAMNKQPVYDVPSECEEEECGGCDTSFWVDGHSDDDVANASQNSDSDCDFHSERFFQEEESSRPSHTFDPDLLSDLLQTARAQECREQVAPSPKSSPNPVPRHHVPVKSVQVCDHSFNGPTLRMRRLFYLRQMHVLMELGRTDAFGHERPLIHPVLHAAPPSRGLGWAAEHGVVGGWADTDRQEPRYITHFCGRPSLLFAQERAAIGEAAKRAICVVGQLNFLAAGT